MRQLGRVNGKKVIAFSWWTFGYIVVAATLLMLSAIGDCLQNEEGAACRASSRQFQDGLLVSLAIAYVFLTWLLFFRRR